MKPTMRQLPAPIPFTRQGYMKLMQEKARLAAERPDAVENLRKAREMGDLSENGYYKAARARLSFLDARLRRLDRLIRLGKIVEPSTVGIVEIGSTVTVRDGAREQTYTIVGGYESDPREHAISHNSPIGKSLMGKKAGEVVEVNVPAGVVLLTITHVS